MDGNPVNALLLTAGVLTFFQLTEEWQLSETEQAVRQDHLGE